MKDKQFITNTSMEYNDIFFLYGSNNFGLPRLYICYNYKPNSDNYDERGVGLRYVDGRWCVVTERNYY